MANIALLPLLAKVLCTTILILVARCIYRVTFHPLAGFPGPKLASMTRLYAMFFDLPVASSYVKEFGKLHDKYGPVIRIEPNHLHIRDMDAYNQVFKVGTKFNRDPVIYSFPFTKGSMFNKLTVKEGKAQRDLYTAYFSRANVHKMEHLIREHLATFFEKLAVASTSGREVDLSLGFRCLTADSLMHYCYDKPFSALKYPDFKTPMIVDTELFFDNATLAWYFPTAINSIVAFIERIPRKWIGWHKPFAAALKNIDSCRSRIKELRLELVGNMSPSVFQTALHPNPEKGQPILDEDALTADAFVMFTAGMDTTAHAFVTGTWNLLNNPPQLAELQKSLKIAIPNPTIMNLDWQTLEQIPYLRAVVKESIRLSYGVPGKIPRQTPPGGATLCGQHIPEGTMLSMTCYTYHQNPDYFPNASQFMPERWLDEKAAAENDKHFIAFSRGSRNCIGMNLAYAELFYGFAYLFRRFEMTKAEGMTDHDMEWHDAFVVATLGHLRVMVKELRD